MNALVIEALHRKFSAQESLDKAMHEKLAEDQIGKRLYGSQRIEQFCQEYLIANQTVEHIPGIDRKKQEEQENKTSGNRELGSAF